MVKKRVVILSTILVVLGLWLAYKGAPVIPSLLLAGIGVFFFIFLRNLDKKEKSKKKSIKYSSKRKSASKAVKV